jgi:hypothetical protein
MDARPDTIVARAMQYVVKDVNTVDISQCIPGSQARAVKPGGVASLIASITEHGYKPVIHIFGTVPRYLRAFMHVYTRTTPHITTAWSLHIRIIMSIPCLRPSSPLDHAQESMISVQQTATGELKIIDGMHRVTALQKLSLAKHPGIDFTKVHLN